jgi:hypothetical protein
MPYKINQERRHKIPKARYRVKNWRDYDAALRRRGDLTVWVTPAAMVLSQVMAGDRTIPEQHIAAYAASCSN